MIAKEKSTVAGEKVAKEKLQAIQDKNNKQSS